MDPTGCSSPDLVTDAVFAPRDETVACTASLTGFWVGTMILLALRILSCTIRIVSRRNRIRKRQQETKSVTKKPKRTVMTLGSVLDSVSVVSYLLLYVLAGTNVVNYYNGWALALYSLSYLPFAMGFTVFLFRTVRLGTKIVPLKGDMAQRNDLRTFNGMGQVLFVLQIGSLIASSLLLIVFGPIFPTEEAIFSALGFASKAVFMICTGLGIINQIERCIRAIRAVTENAASKIDVNQQANVSLAIKRLRYNQVLVILIDLPIAVVLALITFRGLQLTWVLAILVVQGAEVLGSLAILVPFFMKKKSANNSNNTSNMASNNNNNNNNKHDIVNVADDDLNKPQASEPFKPSPSKLAVKHKHLTSSIEPSSLNDQETLLAHDSVGDEPTYQELVANAAQPNLNFMH